MKSQNQENNGQGNRSPPSRGAWIEMPKVVSKAAIKSPVAPLAGGVD